MAVAVKHNQDTSSAGVLDRMPVALLMGVLYVFGSLGILFPLLDGLWWRYVFTDPLARENPVAWIALLTVGAFLGGGLVWLGLVLLGPKPARGLKAGIILSSVAVGLIALLGLYLGRGIEELLFARQWFGPSDRTAGIVITLAIAGALLVALVWQLLQPRTEKFFGEVEDQGWFSLSSYKRNQGQRVRRGTIIGLVLVIGFGLRSLAVTLERDPGPWNAFTPFTGKLVVNAYTEGDLGRANLPGTEPFRQVREEEWAALTAESERLQGVINETPRLSGLKDRGAELVASVQQRKGIESTRKQMADLREAIAEQGGEAGEPTGVVVGETVLRPGGRDISVEEERFALRDLNQSFERNYVKVESPGFAGSERQEKVAKTFAEGAIVPKSEAEAEKTARANLQKELEEKGSPEASLITDPKVAEVKGATGTAQYFTLTLLPAAQYTLPALLGLLTVWFAWRVVNFPGFADFLIATEAELNKVSWVTRRQLFQDTVVVLVTVVLMTVFLLLADLGWSSFLQGIGVLRQGNQTQQRADQELKW